MINFKGNTALHKKLILDSKKKKKKQEFSVDKMIFEELKLKRFENDLRHTDMLSDNKGRHSSLRKVKGKHCFRNYGEGERCIEDNVPAMEEDDYEERFKRNVKQALYESELKEVLRGAITF